AKRVGPDRIAAMAHRLGLGETYGLHLQGQGKGLVPTPAWKLATQGTRWSLGETLVIGIGQGAYLATPLQMAVMAARLANGEKAVTPRLVYAVGEAVMTPAPFADLGLDSYHLSIVRRGMRGVLEPGGTAALSRLTGPGMSMAGKTGSSQVRRISKAERDAPRVDQMDKPWEERDHAIFVAYGPVEAPRYALSVVVEHGGGGARAAAPVARDILRKALELDPAARPVIMPLPDGEAARIAAEGTADG
ncbi:MAG TPA: penicillin-binding transpeptidase domain-containing protein, partial [Sphingomonadales bacterium]|nr:penicillin-binding transpeptidase domain-containing protein [Sphingomonadales bacterium]